VRQGNTTLGRLSAVAHSAASKSTRRPSA
jgi:hypothetical protein